MAHEYYREHETRRMIENYVRWSGDGERVRCALSTLDVLRTELHYETHGAGPRIPVLALDASRTGRALELMDAREARALELHYAARGTASTKARRMGVSRRTFYSVLEVAHYRFWAALDEINRESRQAMAAIDRQQRYLEATRVQAGRSLEPPSAGLPRLGKRRRRKPAAP